MASSLLRTEWLIQRGVSRAQSGGGGGDGGLHGVAQSAQRRSRVRRRDAEQLSRLAFVTLHRVEHGQDVLFFKRLQVGDRPCWRLTKRWWGTGADPV